VAAGKFKLPWYVFELTCPISHALFEALFTEVRTLPKRIIRIVYRWRNREFSTGTKIHRTCTALVEREHLLIKDA
jgi:hypothetical protein